MNETINLVLYSNGEPYTSSKKKLIETIYKFSNRKIKVHDYDLNKIMELSWYDKIKDLPGIKNGKGRRDGYYNCWKSFIVNEVYQNMNEGEILYYVDSSRYYRNGFTQNIDKLCDLVLEEGIIAGSVGNDIKNNTIKCCDNINIWNKIIPNNDNNKYLNKMHILNSWFICVKNNINTNFLNDWNYWSVYKDDEFKNSLVTYHHTVDQSIFNILVYKYKFKVFYHPNIGHNANKDRKKVLKVLNNDNDYKKYLFLIKY